MPHVNFKERKVKRAEKKSIIGDKAPYHFCHALPNKKKMPQ
jgi:hypothetical protein